MGDTQQMLLKDVVRFGTGKPIKPSGDGRYPAYGSNGIIGGSDEFRHENGIVIGRVGAYCGSVIYCPDKFWASDNTLVAYPMSEQVDTKFLFYALKDANLSRYAGGAAQPLVTQTVLKQVVLRIPSLPIQQRIAGILTAYDELIENNQRRSRILESMARAVYREWFVDFRFPGHEFLPRVASPLGEIPQGWEVKTLDEVVDDIVDYRGKTPTKLNGKWSDEGILALSALNVKGGRLVNLEKSRCIDEDLYSRWMKNPLRQGDILMTSEAPLGELFFMCKERRYCLSQRLFSIRANRREIAPEILYLCMDSEQTQHELRSRASGATVSGIRQSELRNISILVPPRGIQERAAPVLQNILALKGSLDDSLANLQRTRNLLLPRLLSGQLDVQAV
jgi:type I restriction enzyme S subunit